MIPSPCSGSSIGTLASCIESHAMLWRTLVFHGGSTSKPVGVTMQRRYGNAASEHLRAAHGSVKEPQSDQDL